MTQCKCWRDGGDGLHHVSRMVAAMDLEHATTDHVGFEGRILIGSALSAVQVA